jgi:hypothetical protein
LTITRASLALFLTAGLLTAAPIGARADTPRDPPPTEAHPLSLSVGIGGGYASIRPDNTDTLDREFVAVNLQIGWQLSPRWRIGMDVHGGVFAVEDDWLSINHIDLGVSLFPFAGFGAYLKAAIGLGYLNVTYSRTVVAPDLLGALGYELRLAERYGIGIEASCGFIRFPDGIELDGAVAAVLTFHL